MTRRKLSGIFYLKKGVKILIYNLTNTFTRLSESTGTIQNSGSGSIEVSNQRTFGTGIILKPGEKFSFTNTTLYARAEGKNSIARVVPFLLGAGGVATVSGGGGDSSVPSDYSGDVEDIWDDTQTSTQSYDPDFDNVLDNIYGF